MWHRNTPKSTITRSPPYFDLITLLGPSPIWYLPPIQVTASQTKNWWRYIYPPNGSFKNSKKCRFLGVSLVSQPFMDQYHKFLHNRGDSSESLFVTRIEKVFRIFRIFPRHATIFGASSDWSPKNFMWPSKIETSFSRPLMSRIDLKADETSWNPAWLEKVVLLDQGHPFLRRIYALKHLAPCSWDISIRWATRYCR